MAVCPKINPHFYRQVIGSYEVAKETAMILRQAVSTTRWFNVDLLIEFITSLGGRLVAAQPKGKTNRRYLCLFTKLYIELAVGNIVRRVLKIIREVARGELSHANEENTNDTEEFSDQDADFSSEDEKPTKNNVPVTEHLFLAQSSMFNLLSDGPVSKNGSDDIKNTYNLKPLIIQEINEEIIADLESVYKGIADQATDFIHAK